MNLPDEIDSLRSSTREAAQASGDEAEHQLHVEEEEDEEEELPPSSSSLAGDSVSEGKLSSKSTKYIGVYANRNTFQAIFWDSVHRKHNYCGSFPTAEAAAHAYDLEAMKNLEHGVKLNFPPDKSETSRGPQQHEQQRHWGIFEARGSEERERKKHLRQGGRTDTTTHCKEGKSQQEEVGDMYTNPRKAKRRSGFFRERRPEVKVQNNHPQVPAFEALVGELLKASEVLETAGSH